jgi:uncharacterized protein (TIGR02270 family)
MIASALPATAGPLEGVTSIEDCAEEIDFMWLQRQTAVGAPNVSFEQMSSDDEALAATIDLLQMLHGGHKARAQKTRVIGELTFAEVLQRLFDLDTAGIAGEVDSAEACLHVLGWRPLSAPSIAWLLSTGRKSDFTLALRVLDSHRAVASEHLTCARASETQQDVAQALEVAASCALGEVVRPLHGRLSDMSGVALEKAARAALLLRWPNALDVLADLSVSGLRRSESFDALLMASDTKRGLELLRSMRLVRNRNRSLISGLGLIGDLLHVPWLLDQMIHPTTARIAFESFVHITGADVNLDQLEAMPPDDFDDGPSDDPDDDDVELPEDIALPWPDVERVKAWWMAHRGEFMPGRKLFLGKPITPEHCVHVLKTGFQRQRVIAAHYRCLIQPGTVLFPTSAPAWRQRKLLAAM